MLYIIVNLEKQVFIAHLCLCLNIKKLFYKNGGRKIVAKH